MAAAGAMVDGEPFTVAWFGVQLAPAQFAIFDAFADEAGWEEHLSGTVAAVLMAAPPDLFVGAPNLERAHVLADRQLG